MRATSAHLIDYVEFWTQSKVVKPEEPVEKGVGADVVDLLRDHGIQPSAQRVAVAKYVLRTDEHPSADQVWHNVRSGFPMLSRATVYNTLNLFVEKGLLREFILAEGRLVYDPKTDPHHHFIDEGTGKIHDVPWEAVQVSDVAKLPGFAVRDYQVVMRGQKLPSS